MLTSERPVVVVGSINTDLVATASKIPAPGETLLGQGFAVHPGGKGANQAVAVARLGYPVNLIGRLGDDAFGAQLRGHLIEAGVNVKSVMTSPGPSGVAVIVVTPTGENSIVITPGANALLTADDLDDHVDIIRTASVVLAQLEIPMDTVLHLAEMCLRDDIPLILDPAPAQTLPQELWSKVAWFTPNETEAAFFVGCSSNACRNEPNATAQRLLDEGVRGVILKLGARGAYLATDTGLRRALPAFPIDSVDTTAAGDAFNGAFAAGLGMRMTPIESAHFAGAAAALSVARFGAQPSMPNRAEVMRLLNSIDDAHRIEIAQILR